MRFETNGRYRKWGLETYHDGRISQNLLEGCVFFGHAIPELYGEASVLANDCVGLLVHGLPVVIALPVSRIGGCFDDKRGPISNCARLLLAV